MASSLELPAPDLVALASGITVVAFTRRNAIDLNDELALIPSGSRAPDTVQAAHAELLEIDVPGGPWTALVVGLQPASSLGGAHGMSHHILTEVPDGDAVILRVSGPKGDVLSDQAFAVEQTAVQAAFR